MAEAEAEEHEPILEDVSDGDTDSDDDKGRTKKKDHCDDDDDEKEKEEMKLTEFHAKNYFNSTMGSKGPSCVARHGHWMQFHGYSRPQGPSLLSIEDLPFGDKTGFINTQA